MRIRSSTILLAVCLPLLFAVVAVAYYPGLHGSFLFDDASNITQNHRLQVDHVSPESLWQAAFSVDSGPLKRPISMLTFWVNYYTTGLTPLWFKVTNLLIHLLNGILLFWFSTFLLRAYNNQHQKRLNEQTILWTALVSTGLWLAHPLALTNVLYVVQRMNSLSALFTIAGLICYLKGRTALIEGRSGLRLIWAGLIVFGSLATLSKENGALLPFYMLAIEVTVFRFSSSHGSSHRSIYCFFAITTLLPILAFALFLIMHPGWFGHGYQGRDFTLIQRLMTESRVLWTYLEWIALPNLRDFGLSHDDIRISTGLLAPATTAVAILAWLAVIGCVVVWWRRFPLFAFAVAWFLIGQSMESSIFALEIAFEHRNYLPMYGPLLAIGYLLAAPLSNRNKIASGALATTLVLLLAVITGLRAAEWKDGTTMRLFQVEHHPESSRANYEAGYALGTMMLNNPLLAAVYYQQTAHYLRKSAQLDKSAVNGLFGLILLTQTNDKPLKPKISYELMNRLSTAPLTFTVVEPFRKLTDWLTKGVVKLPKQQVEALFVAAISNPSAGPNIKSTLFSLLSVYYANVEHDMQQAVSFAIAATQEAPGQPVHHLSLADLAIALGNYQLAKSELQLARETDGLNRFSLQIVKLSTKLEKAPKNTTSMDREIISQNDTATRRAQ